MPFIGPLKGACPGLCPQKARRHSLLKRSTNGFFFLIQAFVKFYRTKNLEEYLLFLNFEVACYSTFFEQLKSHLLF